MTTTLVASVGAPCVGARCDGRRARRRRHRTIASSSPSPSSSSSSSDEPQPRPGLNLLGRAVHVSDVLARRPDDVLERLATTSASYDRDVARLETIVPGLARRRARGELSLERARALARDVKRASMNVMTVKLMFDEGAGVDAAAVCAAADGLLDMDAAGAARAREALEGFRALLGTPSGDAFCAGVPAVLLMENDARDGVMRRVRTLRDALPRASIATICTRRPWIALDDEALNIACVAAEELRQAMPPDAKVDMMLTDFPNLLNVDIVSLLEDIERTFGRDPCAILRRDPRIATQFEKNTSKSSPLGPAANTMQADEPNFGLMDLGIE